MQRGDKAYIKRVADELRGDLQLSPFVPFDPRAACRFLDVQVLVLTDFTDRPDIIEHFAGPAQGEFSAVTGFDGTKRFFILNDTHHPHRQTSSLAHELGHALLQHPPAPVLAGDGMRKWDGGIEAEAAFFAGVLLLPDKACWMIAKRGWGMPEASRMFGVSESMVNYRLNVSGARKIASRARSTRA